MDHHQLINPMWGDIRLSSLGVIIPELYLGLASLLLLLYGVYREKKNNGYLVALALLSLAITGYLVVTGPMMRLVELNGMFLSDRFTVMVKCLLLVSAGLSLLLSVSWLREENGRPFEFVILVLLSVLGMMLMVSANDLLSLYIANEMSSLAQYVLASFNRDHAKSSEAGLKYFVLGALASGMMLFGISLVYGFAGSTGFTALASLFATGGAVSSGVVIGLILIIIGFCFKASAVPFHMWTPDVYEGAPTPVTAFFAIAPKVAVLSIFTRLMLQPFGHLLADWQQVVIFMSMASMLVGSLAAIMQTNIKRLLAYSSIGHVGYILMGLSAGTEAGVQSVLIYLVTYVFMSGGMFACVMCLRRRGHYVEEIRELSGLSQTSPALAIAISIFMFSMAGIPPLAGFFSKFYVVLGAIDGGLAWLAVFGVLTSVIGGYYYLKIVKIMYFDAPAEPFDRHIDSTVRAAVLIGAGITLLFFLYPSPLVMQAKAAAIALMH